ncbi:glycosyltransferase family 2 protein [Polynucleobacter paneuropaeus]|jgi:glycosyltransferase involved in cell wall biosynthesis|nr:glycosyltransferase family 2 protein [Polynucleobacter paneuropaeus]MBT8611215.1 glycosyltransferase family 2 protein [Polynucleobacter paneuropaeus]
MNNYLTPLVSVLIPTFNSEKYIEQCVESVLNQTYRNIEIIINDNNSDDKTSKIIKSYLLNSNKIHFEVNKKNIGPVLNWHKCVERATGEYAILLFSDDMLAPDCLQKLVGMITSETIGFAYSSVIHLDESRAEENKNIIYISGVTGKYSSKKFIDGHFIANKDEYPQSPACALFRRKDLLESLESPNEDYMKVGYENHGAGPDQKIYFDTLIKYDSFGYVNSPLVIFRSHKSNLSKKKEVNLAYAISKSQYLMKISKIFTENELKKIRAEQFYLLMRLKRIDLYEKSMKWDDDRYRMNYYWLVKKIFSKLKIKAKNK